MGYVENFAKSAVVAAGVVGVAACSPGDINAKSNNSHFGWGKIIDQSASCTNNREPFTIQDVEITAINGELTKMTPENMRGVEPYDSKSDSWGVRAPNTPSRFISQKVFGDHEEAIAPKSRDYC